jgi:predicted NBD/HSP70 family sugar kinase
VGALAEIRELNRYRLLEELRRADVADRAELARLTGLSRATVSALVSEFLASGALTEAPDPVGTGAPGRPSSQLRLNPRAAAVLGVDFGHRHVRVAVADLAASVLAERRIDLDVRAGVEEAFDTTAELAATLVAETGIERVLGAGMGFPGPIGRDDGAVGASALLREWEGVRPGEALSERLGVPVRVANDADLAALGESTYGAARGIADLLYVKLSVGVGMGLILGGALQPGAIGMAGEMGHLSVDPRGAACRCGGRGCLAPLVSVDAIRAGRPLSRALEDAKALAKAGERVGDVLSLLVTAINPAVVVTGGDLGAPLRDAIEERIRDTALPPTADVPVLAATLADRAELLGAITLALSQTAWLRDAGFIPLTAKPQRSPGGRSP